MIYVMSDIHGYFDEFMKILETISFSDKDELYILGDVIDRGDKPIETLKYILDKPNMHLIMGNHEKMMLDSFRFSKSEVQPTWMARSWMETGGFVTADKFLSLPVQEQIDLLTAISELPYYIIKDKNIFVHAGLPYGEESVDFISENFPIEKFMRIFDKEDIIWDRNMIRTNFKIRGYHIYCGHNPIPYMFPDMKGIYKTEGYTLVDCGVYFDNGKLACYCIDTGEVFFEEKEKEE